MDAADLGFDNFVDLIRERMGAADALEPSRIHSFKNHLGTDVENVPDTWWSDAYDELDAQGHIGRCRRAHVRRRSGEAVRRRQVVVADGGERIVTERQQKLINSIGLRGRLTSDIAAEERADLETLVEAGYIVPHTIELRETGTGGTDHEGIPEWILTDKGKFAITDDE